MPGDLGLNTSTVAAVCSAATLLGGGWVHVGRSRQERRAQALAVVAWIEDRTPDDAASEDRRVVVMIRNSSESQITNVSAWSSRMVTEAASFGIIHPGQTQEIAASEDFLPGWQQNSVDVVVVYTDAQARRWKRAPSGKVRRFRSLRDRYHPLLNRKGQPRRWAARHLTPDQA